MIDYGLQAIVELETAQQKQKGEDQWSSKGYGFSAYFVCMHVSVWYILFTFNENFAGSTSSRQLEKFD